MYDFLVDLRYKLQHLLFILYFPLSQMYWTDLVMQCVEVSELDGSSRRVLFTDLNRPRAITTHYPTGRLFWTDWDEQYPRIEAADMNGHNRWVDKGMKEQKKGRKGKILIVFSLRCVRFSSGFLGFHSFSYCFVDLTEWCWWTQTWLGPMDSPWTGRTWSCIGPMLKPMSSRP